MADNKKSRTVNYRRCAATAPGSATSGKFDLQAEVESASKSVGKPWIRPITTDGGRFQFLSFLVKKQTCLCGTLVVCEDNRLIPLIDAESDGSTWQGTIEPVDSKGKKRRLQEQTLCFAIRENHIAIMPSRDLDIVDLQDFLTWFIQTKANGAQGWLFGFQNLPSKSAVDKLAESNIRGISIGKNAFYMERTEVGETAKGKKKKFKKVIRTDSMVMGWLRAVMKNDALVDELEESGDPGSLYVSLDISYRSRKEKDAQEIMRALAAVVGDQPGLSPEIRLEGRGKIKGSELTISDTVQVQCPSGNLSCDDAMTRLAEWLTKAIKAGTVWS